MTCQGGEKYFLRGLVTFQCIWDELLLMVKLGFLRLTMCGMVGMTRYSILNLKESKFMCYCE